MVIIQESNSGRTICTDAIMCSSLWSQARGLIMSRRKNLLFVFPKPTIARLHMVLVLYPIDVVGIDSRGRVACIERLTPFQFWTSPAPVKYVLELSRKPYRVPTVGSRLRFQVP